jgi:hypothetical protein
MLNVFIRNDQVYSKPLEYVLAILASNKSILITFTKDKNSARLIFDHTDPLSLPINIEFFDSLLNKKVFDHEAYFSNVPCILFPGNKQPDWLGTAFYMLNSFQEYSYEPDDDLLDKYGRFRFDRSYQYKFNCIQKNLVQEYFDNFCREYLPFIEPSKQERKTKVFISHDIDTIYGSFVQDGLWALKKGRIDIILKLVMNEILLNPHWKNIDKIAKINSGYDLVSTFFWLTTKKVAANKIKNADYTIAKIDKLLQISHSNGLHKSCYSTSFDEELNILPVSTEFNRFHYLKINLPSSWDDLEAAKLKLDASLGFAERYGFRNSYGLPFKPFNISTQSPYHFVEVPLNIMDGTLSRYMKIPLNETSSIMIDFIEKNSLNEVISIVWHNTYFTDYKYSGYLQEYKKVLLYLNESGIKFITPKEIINEFANE